MWLLLACQRFAVTVEDVQAKDAATAENSLRKFPSHPVYLLQIIIQIYHSTLCLPVFICLVMTNTMVGMFWQGISKKHEIGRTVSIR